MRYEVLVIPLPVFLISAEDIDFSIRSASSKDQSILPWRPCDAIDRAAKCLLKHNILPARILVLSPNLDFVVVTTRGNHRLKFGMCPCHLPGGTFVRLECLNVLLGAPSFDRTYLEKSVAVTRSQLGSVIVKLDIVDIVLVLRF